MLNVAALLTPDLYDHPTAGLQLIETHISWVILTGNFAYKIKKPVNFGFLDFSTLAKRKFYCEEELRLNQRLAPEIYLKVIPIHGTQTSPGLRGTDEPIIDYAIQMREFSQEAQLDRLLHQGKLTFVQMDAIADYIAAFHTRADRSPPSSQYGDPDQVWHPVAENFAHMGSAPMDAAQSYALLELEAWSKNEFDRCAPLFAQRKKDGFVRECHGDLHLRNLAWLDDQPIAFDCIEFNADLRWIDVISDVAFLLMDLFDRNEPTLGMGFLNHYLEKTGDYAGAQLLPFYFVYRAMVRAKVATLRLRQPNLSIADQAEIKTEQANYLLLAQTFLHKPKPALLISWGLSGAGKSRVTQTLAPMIGAIRVRSDVERKRLAGINASDDAKAAPSTGIYNSTMTEQTYARLAAMAVDILAAGFSAIIDATFQDAAKRELFRTMAHEQNIAFIILECTASPATLRARVAARQGDASDADLAILEYQLTQVEALADSELGQVIRINTDLPIEYEGLVLAICKAEKN